jgi:hypothetical protein
MKSLMEKDWYNTTLNWFGAGEHLQVDCGQSVELRLSRQVPV